MGHVLGEQLLLYIVLSIIPAFTRHSCKERFPRIPPLFPSAQTFLNFQQQSTVILLPDNVTSAG
jgi:hypothetical protein